MGDASTGTLRWDIVTCEFPAQRGGVSDHTAALASALAAEGDQVHVWAPEGPAQRGVTSGVEVHREAGQFSLADLRRLDRSLGPGDPSRRVFIQWVPHGYRMRSLNLPFCVWSLTRAWRGDVVHLMVHEPFLAFHEGSWRQDVAAVVHRLMMVVLMMASRRVWVSTPSWIASVAPLRLRQGAPTWLPIGTNVPVCRDVARQADDRVRLRGSARHVVGHVGTYGRPVMAMLERVLPALVEADDELTVVLMGQGSEAGRDRLVRISSRMDGRVVATGPLESEALSTSVAACDVMFQPFPDGVSYRRTSVMLALDHGKAVVTTSGHLTESSWLGGEAVSIVPAADDDAQVRAILHVLRDSPERRRLESAARELFDRQCDIAHAVRVLRSRETA